MVLAAMAGAALVNGGGTGRLRAEEPPSRPPWQRLLQGADAEKAAELEERLQQLQSGGQFEEARKVAEEIAALRIRLQGADHWQAVTAQQNVAAVTLVLQAGKADREDYTASFAWQRDADALYHKGRYREAQPLFDRVLAVRRKVLGEEDPHTATSYGWVASNRKAQGANREAQESYRKALDASRKVLGDDHPDTGMCYNNLAANLNDQGRYQEAERAYQKALDVCLKALGELHPSTASSYSNIAGNHRALGRYQEAEQEYQQALHIFRQLYGDENARSAVCYSGIAISLKDQGRYQEAEPYFQKALDIFRKVLGDEHPTTAQSYSNAATNLKAEGRYQEAELYFQKALDVFRKMLGEDHPLTAAGYNNLGNNLYVRRRFREAEQAHQKALALRRKVLGEEHTDTARSYNTLAGSLNALGRYQEAEQAYRTALAIRRKLLGEEHPETATSYGNVAFNAATQGHYQEADQGFRKALDIHRKALGEKHLDTARAYDNLAANLHAEGRYQEAEEMYERGARAFLASRMHFAATGLGRAARTSEQSPLLALAAVLARNGKPAAAWQGLEQGLGRGAWDDLSARLRRPAREQARQTEVVAQLERLDQLLAQPRASGTPTPAQQQEREALLDRRLKTQAALTRLAHELQEKYGPAEGKVFDREQIQAALPAATALVAWIDLPPRGPGTADRNGERWAVLLRSRGEPIFERLRGSGPGGSWTEDDSTLQQRLRSALQSSRGDWQALARQLHKQRLGPLRRHLAAGDGLPNVQHLIVLPSTALAGVPVDVLSDEFLVSYALSGTLYAHLKRQPALDSTGLLALGDPVFEKTAPAAKERPLPPGGVLLTVVLPGSNAEQSKLRPDDVLLEHGDVALQTPADLKAAVAAAAGKATVRVWVWREGATFQRRVHGGDLGVVLASKPAAEALAERYRLDRRAASRCGEDFGQLPGTRVEVESLRRLFGAKAEPKLLTDSEASEQRLDELAASGELGKYRYLHLATHGEVDDTWPLGSSLILSRDRLPDPQQQLLAGKPAYDGRLTAEEMLRNWHLNADLVTLSACQTALGKYERGEGFIGFAQALILCGSRSVCLSLWQVDDAATALLMQRFYANLLGKRDGLKGPLTKAEALAEAKRWLRTLPREQALKHAAAVYQGIERGKNRPRLPRLPALPEPVPEAKEDCPYAHPYYWAAFVLIGDPC
jgi:tetratricopeptide (TPR) repeat protein